MKILISSHVFHPGIGGTETVGRILAEEFSGRSHDVAVVTQTPADAEVVGFRVIRRPQARALLELVRWCNVFLHNNLSLRTAWPLLLLRRPWVISHHTWIRDEQGRVGWKERLKQWVLRAATNISISKAMAQRLARPTRVIGNPYQDELFRRLSTVQRDRDLLCVGRLVSEKGFDLFLHALGTLKQRGFTPTATIVGTGPEEIALRDVAAAHGIDAQIAFAGSTIGESLVRLLNQHKVLIAPSRSEVFGLVALEAAACGCVVIGSHVGGLPEAIGPCGMTFPSGDTDALASAIEKVLSDDALRDHFRAGSVEHLAKHSRAHVAEAYLQVLEEVVG